MEKYKYYILIILLFSLAESFAASCEKNGTCKNRFEFQGDPYDFDRESSRSHMAIFFTANFAVNRILENEKFLQWSHLGQLSKTERIIYSSLLLTGIGLAKEFAYDPDGLSTSDTVNNTIAIVLGMTLEFSM